jgi:hypothetical protein
MRERVWESRETFEKFADEKTVSAVTKAGRSWTATMKFYGVDITSLKALRPRNIPQAQGACTQ